MKSEEYWVEFKLLETKARKAKGSETEKKAERRQLEDQCPSQVEEN